MELNLKSEMYLNMLRVAAVDAGRSSGSTVLDKLSAGDVAAAVGMIGNDCQVTALIVCAQLGNGRDEMQLLIKVRQSLSGFDWFKLSDMQSAKFRLKLDRAIGCAIAYIASGKKISKTESACRLGISRKCFYETWDSRIQDIYKLILGWVIDADEALFKRLSGRNVAA